MSTFRVSEWAPANETTHDLYVERTNFDGFQLGMFGYGVQTVLAFLCCRSLLRLRRREPRFAYSLLAYVVVIFILGTLGNAGNVKYSELAFVGNRDYPGGPNAYLVEQGSLIPINLVSYAAYILATWMQDGFLLYRFLVMFNYTWWIAVVPSLVYLLSIIMSIFLLVQLTQNGAELFSNSTVDFALAYWAASIATTLMLTILIVGKLLYMRWRLNRVLGTARHGSPGPYLTVSAMLVESALLYSLVALAFIVLFARNDPFQNIFFPILGQAQIIAPELIILRVAQGRSFTKETFKESTIGLTNPASRTARSKVVTLEMSHMSHGGPSGQSATLNGGDISIANYSVRENTEQSVVWDKAEVQGMGVFGDEEV